MHRGAGVGVGNQRQERENGVRDLGSSDGRALEGRQELLEVWGCPTLSIPPHSESPGILIPSSSLPPIRCLGVAKVNTPLPAGSGI